MLKRMVKEADGICAEATPKCSTSSLHASSARLHDSKHHQHVTCVEAFEYLYDHTAHHS